MKKLLIPAIIMVMGAGAAFATNAAKNSSPLVLQDGYRIDGSGNCILAPQKCNTIETTTCTWQGNVLHEKVSDNPTVCGDQLFMP